MDKKIKVGLYIRVSTDEQAKHGYSIDSQKNRLTEYAKEKKYLIYDTYIDEGKSARSKLHQRKSLLRLLEDIKLNKVDRVVIWRLDRWFRNIKDYYKVQDILDKYKVDWECSDEDYNTTTSNGRLYLNIKLSIAQNESDQTSDRIKFNFENMVRNGHPIGGNLPLGYKIVGEKHNKKVVKDENYIDYIEDAFRVLEETGSIRKAYSYTNDKYHLNRFYSNFRQMISNTMFCGLYRGNEGFCEPYMDKERFDKIQSLINRNNRNNKKRDYVFTGLLKCSSCHHYMAGVLDKKIKNGKKYEYIVYRCQYKYNQKLCSGGRTVSENRLEKYLLDHIKDELDKQVKIINIKDKEKPIDNKKQIENLKERLNRLGELYLLNRIDRNRYNEDFNKTKKKIEELEKLKIKKRDLKDYDNLINTLTARDIYNKLDSLHKNIFWKSIIDYIEPDGDNFNIYLK